jgi:hypothetical protein
MLSQHDAPEGAAAVPPNAELEDMLVRIFAPREIVTSQPGDPARLSAIWEEWRVFYALTWWRTEKAAADARARIAARSRQP